MAKLLILVLLVAFAAAVLSAPTEDDYSLHPEEYGSQVESGSVRIPRATCDLLSGFGVADSACALHCLAKKFKGGWCEKGVCHCRH
ncbi:defensin-C [Microplitis mediator]|uniref:defensin-C n=1 Tax=Microplitis mediator TaxID=375433 RepID=UPI0025550CDB|nr:defensin-C [Microplitis mediator]